MVAVVLRLPGEPQDRPVEVEAIPSHLLGGHEEVRVGLLHLTPQLLAPLRQRLDLHVGAVMAH